MKGANETKAKKSNSSQQLDAKKAKAGSAAAAVVDKNNNTTSDDIDNNNNQLESKMPSKLKEPAAPDQPADESPAVPDAESHEQVTTSAEEVPVASPSTPENEQQVAEAPETKADEATQAKTDKKPGNPATAERTGALNKFGQPRRSKFYGGKPYNSAFGSANPAAAPPFASSVPHYYSSYGGGNGGNGGQYQAYGGPAVGSAHDFPPLTSSSSYDKHAAKQAYSNTTTTSYNHPHYGAGQPAYYFPGSQPYQPYYPPNSASFHGGAGAHLGALSGAGRFYGPGSGGGAYAGNRRPYNGTQPYKSSKFNKAQHEGGQKDGAATVDAANPTDKDNSTTTTTGEANNKQGSAAPNTGGSGSGHHYAHHHHAGGGYHPSSMSGNYYYRKERMASVQLMTSKTNIYIKGLDENTTDKDLYEMCQKFGEIKSTKAIIEKQNGKCKGYGFVDYKNPDDARKALEEMKKEQKDVQLAKQREQDPTNLYFANLPADIDENCLTEMLQNKFSASVSSTRIMRERSGASKGVGFARIDDNSICDNIIKELNNRPFPDHSNKSKLLLVKLADSGSSLKTRPPMMRMPPNGGAPLYIPAQPSSLDNLSTTANPLSSNSSALKATQGAMPAYSYIDPAVNYNGFSLQMLDSQHSGASLVAQQPHHYQSQSQSLPHAQIGGHNAGGYYNHHQHQHHHHHQMAYGGSRQSNGSAMTPVGSQVPGQQQPPATGSAPAAGQFHYQPYQQASYYSTTHLQPSTTTTTTTTTAAASAGTSSAAGSYMGSYPGAFQPSASQQQQQLNGVVVVENGGMENGSTTVNQQQQQQADNSSNPMTASLTSQFVPSAQFSAV